MSNDYERAVGRMHRQGQVVTSNAESVMQEALEALQTVRKVREVVGAWGHETTVEAVERFRGSAQGSCDEVNRLLTEREVARQMLDARGDESIVEATRRVVHEREESEHLRRVIHKVREALGAPSSESVVEAAQRVARELGVHDEREAMCAYIFEIRKVLGAKPELTALEAIHNIAQVLHHSEGETLIDAATRVMLERDNVARELGVREGESTLEAAQRVVRVSAVNARKVEELENDVLNLRGFISETRQILGAQYPVETVVDAARRVVRERDSRGTHWPEVGDKIRVLEFYKDVTNRRCREYEGLAEVIRVFPHGAFYARINGADVYLNESDRWEFVK